MLPLGFAMLIVGGIVSVAGVTGSTIHSVVQGKPDKSKAGGGGSGGGGSTSSLSTTPSSAVGETPKAQAAVRKAIVAFFMGKGLTKAQAAGIAGNAQQESGLNPQSAGGGLFQDLGGRGAGQGASLTAQLEAAWSELLGPESATLSRLRSTSTPQSAAKVFSELFERPSEPDLSNREAYAAGAYSE